MLNLSKKVRIFLSTAPVDMRKQMNGLAIAVREGLGREPRSGDMFVFRNRRGDMARVLFHDQQGYCLLSKRLDKGVFAAVPVTRGTSRLELTADKFARFLKAMDFQTEKTAESLA